MARRRKGSKRLALAVLVILVVGIVVGTVFAVRSRMSSASSDYDPASKESVDDSAKTTPSASPTGTAGQGKPYLAAATVKINSFIKGYYLYIFHQPVSMKANEIRLNRAADENFTENGPAEETIPLAIEAKAGTPLAVIGHNADDK